MPAKLAETLGLYADAVRNASIVDPVVDTASAS